MSFQIAGIAQLVEHLVYTEAVVGSSPAPPTISTFMKQTLAILAAAAMLMIGCDWLGNNPVSNCDKCGHCAAGCCLSGECDHADCDCSCKE